MRCIVLYDNEYYIEYPLTSTIEVAGFKVSISNDDSYIIKDETTQQLGEIGKKVNWKDLEVILLKDYPQTFAFSKEAILIGKNNGDICVDMDIEMVLKRNIVINEKEYPIFLNGKKQQGNHLVIQTGDTLLIGELLVVVHEASFSIYGNEDYYSSSLPQLEQESIYFEGFPEYKRSPRLIKKISQDKVTLLKPPTSIPRKKGSLIKVIIPPLSMAGVSAMSAMLMGRGLFVIVALAGTLVTLVFSVTTFFSENKILKEKNRKRVEIYENYLLDMRKSLDRLKSNEIEAWNYNYPDIQEIETLVNHYSPRIYERDTNDDDFLSVCIGRAEEKAEFNLTLDYDTLATEKDELLDEAKDIYHDYQVISNKPIIVNLKNTHLGLVGEDKEIHQQIKYILAQITFFQSYHDVEVIMLYNKKFIDEFDYIKRYPHVRIHSVNLTGNINSERVKDQVLGSLYQILKDRKIKRDENKKEMNYFPHFVIVVDDYRLIMSHSIMEYLQESRTDLGFTLIYTAQKRANLPENIKTVLVIEDRHTATLLLNEGVAINKKLNLSMLDDIHLDKMARNLSSLVHLQGISAHIPESISYFELYGVKTPEELNIKERWQKGESHKSLAVPLGLRGEDDIVELNLHEKAHGPHGLVAGTTGSGKSEIIQSYILSLATNFSPYEVGFLLIDYKGGGMANLFKNLPHLLGTITNLDGAESMRALASIKAELSRRQRIFNEFEVNNINKYTQLFKNQVAKEPLPHLFIISDEFAELKKEQPEFMSELVSVARIGRTLGVHLILATQKPTGVVDDQIWSNSKFKLALKVQNESDSKEIIKTADASFITLPGRAYLQVGNNEIYELFQSAWSGANYLSQEESNTVDHRIYKINSLGQSELINQDLSDIESGKETSISQLDAVVNHIQTLYNQEDHLNVTKPWLPSLGIKLISPYIRLVENLSSLAQIDLKIAIGLVDIPEQQKQTDYLIDFVTDGNLAIFASSGYGNTMTLSTIILSLAIKNNPQYLNFYILDFGNSGLISFNSLPQTADYMTFDSTEKINKFILLMQKQVKERKRILGEATAQNFDVYNKMYPDKKLNAIIVVIDKYDIVKEISMDFEDFLSKLTRDGASLGIYTVISATRVNAVRFATMNNFKNKIAQYMFDESDINALIGRSIYKLNEIKGRALIKNKIVSMMQIYLPVSFVDDVEYIEQVKKLISDINSRYTGEKILGIPVLPDMFTTKDFPSYKLEGKAFDLVGLSIDNVELVNAGVSNFPYMIVGPAKCGKTNLLESLMSQCLGTKYLFDSKAMDLYKYKQQQSIHYIETIDEQNLFIDELTKEVNQRKEILTKTLMEDTSVSRKELVESMVDWNVYIDEADDFIERFKDNASLKTLLLEAGSVGVKIIFTVSSSKLKGYDELTKFFKETRDGVVLGELGMINTFQLTMRDIPAFGYGVLFNNGTGKKVKLPKYVEV